MKMDKMDGKKVRKIYFDETGNSGLCFDGESIKAELSYEFHGDHAECWIVVSQDGIEMSRFNTAKISSIEWLQEPTQRVA